MENFDLLKTVEYGGCSAKLSAAELTKALEGLPATPHHNLIVDIETHDDAGVFKISDNLALIQTTDFFTPVCSDPYEFGQISAANALSDVYAMGGEVLTALNIVAFPTSIPLEVLREILRGGIDKVMEAGGVMAGGHTIVDDTPKYGLAVTGTIHPDAVITNAAAQPGDALILTKSIGVGIIMAGQRIGEAAEEDYRSVIESMKQLNKNAAAIMRDHKIRSATDITGYGLAGHALKMAKASGVAFHLYSERLPVFHGVMPLLELGCIPGACFRNLEYVENDCSFGRNLSYENKMLFMDAQTSGGILLCAPAGEAEAITAKLRASGFESSKIIGEVAGVTDKHVNLH
jgi:selenide, water dikinase